jgi:thiol-disulfide isomerase/thioredoxin
LIGILIAVVVVVGIVAGADLLLSFAVIRRLSALQAKMQGGGGGHTSPAVGHQVGDFEVELLTGGVFTLADLMDGASVVIFLTTTCEPCKAAIAELREMSTPPAFPMYVLINATDLDEEGAVLTVAADMPPGTRVAQISASHPVMQAFGIDGFPTVLGIEDGIVRASDYLLGRVLETANR